MSLVHRASVFAERAHTGQVRKYTGEPYINHPARVAGMVGALMPRVTIDMIAAAWLHDVIEDCGTPYEHLRDVFGRDVADLVLELTEFSTPTDGNRAFRKLLDRRYLARVSPEAKTIKLADLIDNTRDIVRHDPDFARVYLAEKRELLPLLAEGNTQLLRLARDTLETGEALIMETV